MYATTRYSHLSALSLIAREAQWVDRDWWLDGIALSQHPQDKKKLVGASRLFYFKMWSRDGTEMAIERRTDLFMAGSDAHFIIKQLCAWSGQYDVDFELSFANMDPPRIGAIQRGVADEGVSRFPHWLAPPDYEGLEFDSAEAAQIAAGHLTTCASRSRG
jgi:hypothetical protein